LSHISLDQPVITKYGSSNNNVKNIIRVIMGLRNSFDYNYLP